MFQLTKLVSEVARLPRTYQNNNEESALSPTIVAVSSTNGTTNNNPPIWFDDATWRTTILHRHSLTGLSPAPPNLPSIRVNDSTLVRKRRIYGGVGDKAHLGGFTKLDPDGISPVVWTNMITVYGIHSVIDVGCGRGVSTRWFLEHGAKVLCVEGSHDAVTQSFLPSQYIVEHDYARGPWWPNQTYDVAWCVEFLEHVSRQYLFNYMQTFRQAALIFATSSRWGGWHHVEIHSDVWWIRQFRLHGFQYEPELTAQVRKWAKEEAENDTRPLAPNGKPIHALHVEHTVKVFSNPAVASLPQHAHLFPHHGCFQAYNKDQNTGPDHLISITRPCGRGVETKLPPHFEPLPVLPHMHQTWHDTIRDGL